MVEKLPNQRQGVREPLRCPLAFLRTGTSRAVRALLARAAGALVARGSGALLARAAGALLARSVRALVACCCFPLLSRLAVQCENSLN